MAITDSLELEVAAPARPAAAVLLVDGHALYRRGLRELLGAAGRDIDVVADVATGEAALAAIAELAPDVVLMDLHLPGLPGPEAIRRLIPLAPLTRVLVLSASADDGDIVEAIVAGAHGYLLKDASVDELEAAVHAAAAGQSSLSPSVAARLLARIRTMERRLASPRPMAELTERETEVLRLLAAGLENADIARELVISTRTVKNHVANILAKLQMENRIQAAVFAVREGLA